MPRNSQGLYTLPAGNPVVAGTLIEADWANPTLADIAQAITDSLPRNGTAPMTGPLILNGAAPVSPKTAVSKAYVDQFLSYASGMPVGFVAAYAADSAPGGWLLCDGSAVSRTTYAALFALIGTTYGAGDSSTTFNLPDLRGDFVRGRPDGRTVGSKQAGSFASHIHPVVDPGHTHLATQAAHTHGVNDNGHVHGVNDPGHSHVYQETGVNAGAQVVAGSGFVNASANTNAAQTGIQVANAITSISLLSQQPAVTVAAANTGETIGAAGGTETVPQNTALDYYIKAVQDAVGPTAITGLTSSDEQMIGINNTNPVSPELLIHANIAFGIPKLGQDGKIAIAQMPAGAMTLLGVFDASGGNNPSQAYPAMTFHTGDSYIVGVAGTITVINASTNLPASVAVQIGWQLFYITGSPTSTTGWYYTEPSVSGVTASQVAFIPTAGVSATDVQAAVAEVAGDVTALAATVPTTASQIANVPAGGIAATTVQAALNELDSEKATATLTTPRTGTTGQSRIPAGTTAQRASGVLGDFRYNSDNATFEGFGNSGWGNVGGAAASNAIPLANGAASAGVSANASRNDHVHPFASGQVIQEVVATDPGGSTTNVVATQVTATPVAFTPKSNNSKIIVECSGYSYSGTTAFANLQLSQITPSGVNISGVVSIGQIAPASQIAGGTVVRGVINNASLAVRTFVMYLWNSAAPGFAAGFVDQVWSIREIQN